MNFSEISKSFYNCNLISIDMNFYEFGRFTTCIHSRFVRIRDLFLERISRTNRGIPVECSVLQREERINVDATDQNGMTPTSIYCWLLILARKLLLS